MRRASELSCRLPLLPEFWRRPRRAAGGVLLFQFAMPETAIVQGQNGKGNIAHESTLKNSAPLSLTVGVRR